MKLTVLLAEDHPAMRTMLAKILRRDFDLIASVESGVAAIATASEVQPEVLVVDVRMPVVDGIEVARRLKQLGSQAKIVFVSVSESANQIHACFEAGGDAYVSKLHMATDLIRAVEKVLQGEKFSSVVNGVSMPTDATPATRRPTDQQHSDASGR